MALPIQTMPRPIGSSPLDVVAEEAIPQHSIRRSIILHLLPGALILAAYCVAAPVVMRRGYPAIFALLLAILIAAIPSQLGHLLFLGWRRNQRVSLKGIVLYRERLTRRQYALFVPLLVVWSFVWLGLLAPVDQFLGAKLFSWLPMWFVAPDYSHLSRQSLIVTAVAALALNGLIAPVVEEMYFRGYLLPRISRLKGRAPLLNLALFTVYHFWQPWQYLTIFVALLPLVYPVWWKRSITLSIMTHCALNLIGNLAFIALILRQH